MRCAYYVQHQRSDLAFKNFNEIDVTDITRDPFLILIA